MQERSYSSLLLLHKNSTNLTAYNNIFIILWLWARNTDMTLLEPPLKFHKVPFHLSRSLAFHLELRIPFQDHSDCWQNSICSCRTKVPDFSRLTLSTGSSKLLFAFFQSIRGASLQCLPLEGLTWLGHAHSR